MPTDVVQRINQNFYHPEGAPNVLCCVVSPGNDASWVTYFLTNTRGRPATQRPVLRSHIRLYNFFLKESAPRVRWRLSHREA